MKNSVTFQISWTLRLLELFRNDLPTVIVAVLIKQLLQLLLVLFAYLNVLSDLCVTPYFGLGKSYIYR